MSILRRVAVVCALLGPGVRAGVTRTQTVRLESGWNSVFLEVAPVEPSPAKVFGELPVDVVATFYPATTSVQFVSDPGEAPWKKEGWGVWYAPGRAEASFSSLKTVLANRPYLIHAKQPTALSVTGVARLNHTIWKPNSFNYVGFGVDADSPPTFGEFFAGSKAHATARFYRLVDDTWQKVASPAATAMRPGEAYWVYCSGRSAFQGPIAVSVPGLSGIEFGEQLDTAKITLLNAGTDPRTARVDAVPADGLPLSRIEPDWENLRSTYPPLQASTELPELAAGATDSLELHLRREQMTDAVGSVLLKLTTDNGQVHWVPVSAKRNQ